MANLVFASIALEPELFGHGKGKDYPLWYLVGRRVLGGGDLYHNITPGQAFDFLYPPFAAILLTPFTLFGRPISIALIVLVNTISWAAAVRLSDRLSGCAEPKPWLIYALPSVLCLPFLWDMFDLGQPNLMLLAIVLGGLAFLQGGRPWAAGALFAAAASLKAFPAAVLPYLLWRRRWRAAASMTVFAAIFLILVPAPIRGMERNLADLRTWADGMVFSASKNGFGQRPEQNWSWKNNSLIAVTHRYVRKVNFEQGDPSARPLYVNALDLSYDEANLVVLILAGLLGLGFVLVLPPETARSPASDGVEYALLICLMTIASPLARAYYFVWLLFPYTVLIYQAALGGDARTRRTSWILLAVTVALFTAGFPFVSPHWAQALGNMLWATIVLMGALAWRLLRVSRSGRLAEPETFHSAAASRSST